MSMSVTRLLSIIQTRHRLVILNSIWLNMNRPRLLHWQLLFSICAAVCHPVDDTPNHSSCARASSNTAIILMLPSTSQFSQSHISAAPVCTYEVSVPHRVAHVQSLHTNIFGIIVEVCQEL